MVPQSHLYILNFFGEVNILEHLIGTYLLTVEKMVLFSSFLKSAHFPALSIVSVRPLIPYLSQLSYQT